MTQWRGILELIGTLWPLATFPLTLIIAILVSKRQRWPVLFILPVALILPCIVFAEYLSYNGNLLFAVAMGFSIVGWVVYYIVLILVVFVRYLQHKQIAAPAAPGALRARR